MHEGLSSRTVYSRTAISLHGRRSEARKRMCSRSPTSVLQSRTLAVSLAVSRAARASFARPVLVQAPPPGSSLCGPRVSPRVSLHSLSVGPHARCATRATRVHAATCEDTCRCPHACRHSMSSRCAAAMRRHSGASRSTPHLVIPRPPRRSFTHHGPSVLSFNATAQAVASSRPRPARRLPLHTPRPTCLLRLQRPRRLFTRPARRSAGRT
mmetsp:Transcript_20962/g.56395  ORF Transcript_20962/g.56395 Transcript_20962/m.56395 type:complete len:211 (-) Transcript_20962:592-1224(-)